MADLPIEIDCLATSRLQSDRADFLLLDCRGADEYATASIAGATLIPMNELPDRVAELGADKARRIVVHCHHGGRSLRVANWLRGQGYLQAQSLAGGIDAWSQEIDPAVPRY
jgi:rhodanese-related sulfurtransferase